jgi:2-polyprenyl-3-methyl-5-hydroxy-6-metoxy-1,4-benzoquinol methylase
LAADYDRFVNWKARLSHELPFLDALFKEHGVRRVLDAACGTGYHAIALAQRGYEVAGADLSAAMIDRARQNAQAEGVEVHLAVAGLGELATLGRTFDAVLCLGNSLPHLLSAQAVDKALADFAAVLRPGGLLVIQNRNFDLVWARQERFMPPQAHREEAGEWLFLRFYDFHAETVTFNMIRLRRTEEGWAQHVESTELRPIFRDDLATALATAGLDRISFYGSYDGSSFDPAQSGDLIAVALKTA